MVAFQSCSFFFGPPCISKLMVNLTLKCHHPHLNHVVSQKEYEKRILRIKSHRLKNLHKFQSTWKCWLQSRGHLGCNCLWLPQKDFLQKCLPVDLNSRSQIHATLRTLIILRKSAILAKHKKKCPLPVVRKADLSWVFVTYRRMCLSPFVSSQFRIVSTIYNLWLPS